MLLMVYSEASYTLFNSSVSHSKINNLFDSVHSVTVILGRSSKLTQLDCQRKMTQMAALSEMDVAHE